MHEKNCFLTLTYDHEHVPKDGSLKLEDYQLFMKRLRKEYGPGIRFYHCGEYGEENGRPHYHSLLFNHDFPDRKYFKGSGERSLYTSSSLSKLWPMGHSLIGNVTFESAAYVARYIMKKVKGDEKEAHYGLRKPEYTTMSRRPGIGARWFEVYKGDVYPRDCVVVRGTECRPPRYYDSLLAKEDPSTFELLKIERAKKYSDKYVDDVIDGENRKVSDQDSFRLLVKEEVKRAEANQLIRPLEIE